MGVSVVPPLLDSETFTEPSTSCWLFTVEQPIEP
jgi:hypothetical protein